jgi:hypothetical protein
MAIDVRAHSGMAAVTAPSAHQDDMDARWEAWQTRGREGDRRQRVLIWRLLMAVAVIAGGWWVTLLV